MDSESWVPRNAEDWLRYARSDLKLARIEGYGKQRCRIFRPSVG